MNIKLFARTQPLAGLRKYVLIPSIVLLDNLFWKESMVILVVEINWLNYIAGIKFEFNRH